jgi:hypothetical protein
MLLKKGIVDEVEICIRMYDVCARRNESDTNNFTPINKDLRTDEQARLGQMLNQSST